MLEFHFGGKIRAWKPQMLPIPNMVTTGTAVRHYVCIKREPLLNWKKTVLKTFLEKDSFLRLFIQRVVY